MYKTHATTAVVLALVSAITFKLVPAPESPAPVQIQIPVDVNIAAIPSDLTLSQRQILNHAYQQAKADGHREPHLVQGVLLQESSAGVGNYKVVGTDGNKFFGLGQITLGAAKEVMKAWPKLWEKYTFQTRTDDELKANLILNQRFNIELTSKYLKLLNTRYGYQGRELLNAYNQGPGGVKAIDNDEFHYAVGVEAKLAAARQQGKI